MTRSAKAGLAWAWTDRPGLETLRLVRDATGTTAEGSVLVVLDGAPVSARDTVEPDAAWRFRQARIETTAPAPDAGVARYRYHNLDSGFVGELTLGSDGLVVEHGPWARR